MTADEAVDTVLGKLKTMWSATGYLMVWPFKADEIPSTQVPWARCKLEHVDSKRLTLGDAEGKALWERSAKLIVEINFPADKPVNATYTLSEQVINEFEGKHSNGVRFFSPRRSELGIVDGWLKFLVVVGFKYENYK